MTSSSDLRRVLVVTEAGDAWPSGHVRAAIYRRLFEQDGIEVDLASRSVPWLTRLIEQPRRPFRHLVQAGAGRVLERIGEQIARARERAIIRTARRGYDVIYLQKVASWRLVAALREACRSRLVYDLNDGVWLPARAGFAGGRIRDILKTVDGVTCDNPGGVAFARQHNASVSLVPDPAQVELFDEHRGSATRNAPPVVLGWIGSPATAFNLYVIWEALEALFAQNDGLTLRLVGCGHDRRLLPRFEKVRCTTVPFYSRDEMIREVLQMDVGLFPLFDVEDSRVRGVLKATVYMSGGACVVASPVGQTCELIRHGENGLLARSTDEWLEHLMLAVRDAQRRQQLAAAGLQTVRERFSLPACYERLLHALAGAREIV